MATVDHSFEMQAPAPVGQDRFRDESGLVLERMGSGRSRELVERYWYRVRS